MRPGRYGSYSGSRILPKNGRCVMDINVQTMPTGVPACNDSPSTTTAPVRPHLVTLAGRTAIVTGAGSGISAAIAAELAQTGAYVLVQDLRLDPAAVVESIRATGGAAEAIGGDVSNPDDVRMIVDALLPSHDRVDILVKPIFMARRSG